uniref:Integrase catalytic domain-containing protein n=1 Tax=Nothobranchius furzeri TaxID=105023 RepID=A0A8C6PF69_NOTFU
MEEVMKKVYFTPEHQGSYGGVERFRTGLQQDIGEKVSSDKARDFLSEQDAYTLHKPARVHFPRNKVFVSGPLKQFQADLCDMQALSKSNDGFNYLLTVIDVFSKKAYVRALKNKSGKDVTEAFASVLKDSGVPKKLQTDSGKEFFNKKFEALMKKHGIVHFATASSVKANVVERFNRTLKGRMWRYFTAKNTHRYIDVIQDLVKGYNHSNHSSIKTAPFEVNTENQWQVFCNLFGTTTLKPAKKMKFNRGDVLRIAKLRGVFDKKYEQSFTHELFTVDECLHRSPPVYKLKDFDGEKIEGSFYEAELQKVNLSTERSFHVEKVLKRRTYRGQKQVFVKWLGLKIFPVGLKPQTCTTFKKQIQKIKNGSETRGGFLYHTTL